MDKDTHGPEYADVTPSEAMDPSAEAAPKAVSETEATVASSWPMSPGVHNGQDSAGS